MLTILIISLFSIFDSKPPIVGKVVDQNGAPISFARVSTNGGTTLTDINGVFFLNSECDSITINALSFESIKLPVSSCFNPIVLDTLQPKNIRTLK